MAIKEGDFVEIDFVGKLKGTDDIFDLTKKDVAEAHGIVNPQADYAPKVICVGKGDVVKGLDTFLVGKAAGKSYTVELQPDDAFGKKNPKLIKLVPTSVFRKEKIDPMPGLRINIDGAAGTIKTASGGRVLVDFNHPISGRVVVYDVTINKIITSDTEKVTGIIKGLLGKDITCTVKQGTAHIDVAFPEAFTKVIADRIKDLIPTVKKVTFKEEPKAKTAQKETTPQS